MAHTARRSAAQWAQLLASWNRTTTSPRDFARRLGVAHGTLTWWCWKLNRHAHALAPREDATRFVQVDVARDDTPTGDDAWEFTSVSGDTLRVRGAIDPASLALVLDRMIARRAR
jgi:hypothetical protein